MDANDHSAHEQRLAAALRDLIEQIDISEYRDALGHQMKHNTAYLQAQVVVEAFDLTHEQLCATLEDCDPQGDIEAAARRLFRAHLEREAPPSDPHPDFDAWHSGP